MTRALELEEIEPGLYRQPASALWVPPGAKGVFGGQILGGAMSAAHRTLAPSVDFPLHSMHAYFLLSGNATKPILYRVNRLRDGRSFATRSVTALQDGTPIFEAQLSYHRVEGATAPAAGVGGSTEISHQIDMPAAPHPDTLPSMTDTLHSLLADPRLQPAYVPLVRKSLEAPFPIDVRPVAARDVFNPQPVWPARQLAWMRCTEPLAAGNADLHRSVLAYASDWSLASSSLLPYRLTFASPRVTHMASLDHCLYYHAVAAQGGGAGFRADQWMLYEMESPVARGARGLNLGRIWAPAPAALSAGAPGGAAGGGAPLVSGAGGLLLASCVQEGLYRVRPPQPAASTAQAPHAHQQPPKGATSGSHAPGGSAASAQHQ
jgi:acyl-CoA thioesterase II